MNKKRTVALSFTALIILTVILAAVHLNTRVRVPAGTLQIETAQGSVSVFLSELELRTVRGTLVNGKGEEKDVDAQGLLLSELLAACRVAVSTQVTAIAADEYSAVVTADEVSEADGVYLAVEDGSARLIVFGDPNSKRQVTDIVRLVVV
ncbi:MAG: hypothetical protein NC319_02090 [Butyricicoccus sp.]|nr:hypothetical protein [Butyricicoccus sp.]